MSAPAAPARAPVAVTQRRNRWSRRCYEAALHAMWRAHDAGLVPVLVHGPYTPARHDHAWVEVGGSVIDLTVADAPIPRADFYATNRIDPTELRRYTAREASRLVIERHSCGPWHEGADR